MTRLEHVNVTVADGNATARMLCTLFGWEIRWQGAGKLGGHSIHVGERDSYLALWTPAPGDPVPRDSGRLNHIGVVVDDLDAIDAQVIALGYTTTNHDDYEPGRRFYFVEENGIEIEVVSYTPAAA